MKTVVAGPERVVDGEPPMKAVGGWHLVGLVLDPNFEENFSRSCREDAVRSSNDLISSCKELGTLECFRRTLSEPRLSGKYTKADLTYRLRRTLPRLNPENDSALEPYSEEKFGKFPEQVLVDEAVAIRRRVFAALETDVMGSVRFKWQKTDLNRVFESGQTLKLVCAQIDKELAA